VAAGCADGVRDAGGWLSNAPRMKVHVDNKEGERFVTVQRAPEPTDIQWDNMTSSVYGMYSRKLAGWALGFVLLAVSAGIQTGLTAVAEKERDNRIRLLRQVPSVAINPAYNRCVAVVDSRCSVPMFFG
jgi:hypothetical protein